MNVSILQMPVKIGERAINMETAENIAFNLVPIIVIATIYIYLQDNYIQYIVKNRIKSITVWYQFCYNCVVWIYQAAF